MLLSFSSALRTSALILLSVSVLETQSSGMSINVTAPKTVRRFDDVTLHCDYQLAGGGDQLYTLRWFHNSVPVVRYSPLLRPQIRTEAASRTLRVNQALSSGRRLHLDAVDWNVAGTWKCQIMAEGPSFEKTEASTHLTVVVVPEEGPHMTRFPPRSFGLGDQLEFTCSSCCSFPVTNFTWSVNKIAAMVDKVGGYVSTQLEDGTYSSRSILKIHANEANFIDGTIMRVRCTAFIAPDLYWKTSEVIVKLPRPTSHQQLPFKTARPSSNTSSTRPRIWIAILTSTALLISLAS